MTVLIEQPTELAATDIAAHPWLADTSWSRPMWTIAELEAAKAGRTISVVLPALNEAVRAGFLESTDEENLGFRHAIIHEVFLQVLPEAVRAELHLSAASRL